MAHNFLWWWVSGILARWWSPDSQAPWSAPIGQLRGQTNKAMQNHSGSSVLSNLFLLPALARILGTHGCRRAQPYVTDVPQLAETKKTAARKTDPCKVSVCQPLSCKC